MSYEFSKPIDSNCDTTDDAGVQASRSLMPDMTDESFNSILRATFASKPIYPELEVDAEPGCSNPLLNILKQKEYDIHRKEFEKEGAYLDGAAFDKLLTPPKFAEQIKTNGLSKDVLNAIRNSINCANHIKSGEKLNPIADINQELKKLDMKLEIVEEHPPASQDLTHAGSGGSCLVYIQLVKNGAQPQSKPETKRLYLDEWTTDERRRPPYKR